MAEVPQYPIGGTVAPTDLPTVRVSSDATGGESGAQFQQIGAELQGAAVNYRALQNQVRVNDANNQYRQKQLALMYGQGGYLSRVGVDALQPDSNGQGLVQSYGQQLSDATDQIASDLTPEQQRIFRMNAADMQTSFEGAVQQHVLQQSRSYSASVHDASIKLNQDLVGQYWSDPTKINGGVDSQGNNVPGLIQQGKAEVYASAQLAGIDPSAAMFDYGSGIHTKVIENALANNNPLYATKYMQAHASDMNTNDLLSVMGRVNSNVDANVAQTATNSAAQTLLKNAIVPSNADRLNGLVAQVESGAKDFNADGTPVVSSAGAKYAMQVMPATAANPGHGIAPAASDTPAEYNRVGQQLLAFYVQKYQNIPQALAAYNAGEGNVDKAVDAAKSIGEPDLWFQTLGDFQSDENHQQTANYIAAIAPKYQQGAGAAPLPTKGQFVQAAVDQLGPNPRMTQVALTRQQAEARYTLEPQSRDEQGDQALQAAQRSLIQNGGDFAGWQRDNPDQVTALMQYAPGKMDDAALFAKHISKGENVTNLAAYGEAVTHPDEMAAMPQGQFDQFVKTNMSAADAEKLYQMRADQLNAASSTNPNSINQDALTSKLNKALLDVGIDPQAKDAASRTRYGDIQQTLADALVKQQQQQGKKFAAGEIDSFVDQQFSRMATLTHWFRPNETAPALSTQWSDAPSDVQQKITAAFAARGIAAPTDAQKNRAWLTYKQANPDVDPSAPQQ